jgi:hypothetical protein
MMTATTTTINGLIDIEIDLMMTID